MGNLTWWTTDRDVEEAVASLGVNDFIEVKFYENRANGQSKGFCCVSLGSEASMRTVMERYGTARRKSASDVSFFVCGGGR